MKLGVFAALFSDRPLEETLDIVKLLGLDAIEIGAGCWPGNAHCDPAALLGSDAKRKVFLRAIESRGLVISALSCHGNPIHPDAKRARADHKVFEQTVTLAGKLGVERVITFSGCPGAGAKAKEPNWITSPWPPEFAQMLEWQWSERVVPYWKNAARLCKARGVKVAIEMHPNFVAYNPESMLRLRDVAKGTIGCNFDPSHLFWQQCDPVLAIRSLGDAIHHVHAKDCRMDRHNTAANGVLDTKSYLRESERSWVFRTVGYGNDALVWKDIVSALRMVGYDWAISIEHEDALMSPSEGLKKAVEFLRGIVIREARGDVYWA